MIVRIASIWHVSEIAKFRCTLVHFFRTSGPYLFFLTFLNTCVCTFLTSSYGENIPVTRVYTLDFVYNSANIPKTKVIQNSDTPQPVSAMLSR